LVLESLSAKCGLIDFVLFCCCYVYNCLVEAETFHSAAVGLFIVWLRLEAIDTAYLGFPTVSDFIEHASHMHWLSEPGTCLCHKQNSLLVCMLLLS